MVWFVSIFSIISIISIISSSSKSHSHEFSIDGTVLELDDSNFESAISSLNYLFVYFYAPWCGHCKRLSPELDVAAPFLASLKEPIVIAKVNADKFSRLASKYEIDGFPTLKIFIHGVPINYDGPRKADLLVLYLKKFVASDVLILDSDKVVSNFIKEAGTHFPIFIGFGLDVSMVSSLANKYKKKAWFSIAKDFSEDIMALHDFDKVPALVSLHPNYNEHNVFYGPFEDEFLEDFIKQNLIPSILPISYDTLKLLNGDDRKIVLTFVENNSNEQSKKLIKLLKAAASANRDLIFGYVGVKQWQDFADTFDVNKKTKLPKMIVWDGDEEYLSVIDSENINEEDQGSQITRFLESYREGKTEMKKIGNRSLFGFINSLIGIRTVYLLVFVVAIAMLIQTVGKEEPLSYDDDHASSGSTMAKSKEAIGSGDKED